MTGTHPAVPQADAEEAWSRITRTIRGEGNTGEAHRAAASAGRHEAATHMKDLSKGRSWTGPIIVGVVALAVAIWGVTKLSSLGEDDAVAASVSAPNLQPVISSSAGQIGSLKLGDGTKASVGPESRIVVPDEFLTKSRAVRVDGTASFEVAPNAQFPFRVFANHVHFIATGTKFVVSAYPEDSSAKILVQEGTVTVKAGKQSASVAAGQAMVADQTGIRALSDDDKAEAFAWLDKKLVVKNKPMSRVVPLLARWMNSDVKVPDTPLLQRTATIDSPLDSTMVAIKQIEQSANLKFGYEGQNKVLRDAGAKAAAKPAKKK
jgi:ferric-dicitrate binding protein FerR (iron transport regulator)